MQGESNGSRGLSPPPHFNHWRLLGKNHPPAIHKVCSLGRGAENAGAENARVDHRGGKCTSKSHFPPPCTFYRIAFSTPAFSVAPSGDLPATRSDIRFRNYLQKKRPKIEVVVVVVVVQLQSQQRGSPMKSTACGKHWLMSAVQLSLTATCT